MSGPYDDPGWRPDPRTLEWAMSVIDEAQVGRDVIAQLKQRIPGLSDADPALVGEAAVESALIRARSLAIDAHGAPPGAPV